VSEPWITKSSEALSQETNLGPVTETTEIKIVPSDSDRINQDFIIVIVEEMKLLGKKRKLAHSIPESLVSRVSRSDV
jgi:hypothetical protein